MKTRLIYNQKWLERFGVAAIVLYPFILFADQSPHERTMRHELCHIQQIKTHGVIGFYLSYLLYYFAGLIRFRSHWQSYYANPFEVEAQEAEVE